MHEGLYVHYDDMCTMMSHMVSYIEMCDVNSSLGDTTTTLEYEDEAWLIFWHLISNISHI